jgi:hypothetical protein
VHDLFPGAAGDDFCQRIRVIIPHAPLGQAVG